MQKIIEIKKEKIFDGAEDDLQNFHYEILLNGKIISFKVNDFYNNPLRDLQKEVTEDKFNAIIEEEKFKLKKNLIIIYKSEENLDIQYVIKENYIFIFSFGEYQPTRYIINMESGWIF